MSDEVLLGELKMRRGEVLEMLKLAPDDHLFGLVIAKMDDEIKRLEQTRIPSLREDWELYFSG